MQIKNSEVLFLIASRGVVIFSRILTILLLTNKLGISDYGIYTFIMSITFIVALIGNLGYGYSNIFYLAKNKLHLNNIVGNSILISIFIGLLLGSLFQFFPIVFNKLFSDVPYILVIAIGASIPISIMHRYLIDIVNGIEDYKLYFISFSLGWFIHLILLALMLIFGKLTLINSILTMFLSNLFIVILVLTKLVYSYRIKVNFSITLLKNQLLYGFPLYFRDFFNQINFRFIYILVKSFLNSSSLGIFAVAVQASELLLFIPRAGFTLLFPKFASGVNQKNNKDFISILKKFAFYFSIIITFSFLLYPVIIEYLFEPEYIQSVLPFRILLIGILCIGIINIFESYTLGQNMQNITTKASAISAILLLFLSLIFIPHFGIIGAAIVSSLVYFIYLIITILFTRKHLLTEAN